MTDFAQLIVVFLAVVNPAAVSLGVPSAQKRMATVVGLVTGVALVAASTFGAQHLLDFLAMEPETFRLAAGIVIVVVGLRTIWSPTQLAPLESLGWGGYPLGWPLIANPACIAAAVSFGVDASPGRVVLAAVPWAVLGVALAMFAGGRFDGPVRAAGQLAGLLGVAVGAALIVDGVRAI